MAVDDLIAKFDQMLSRPACQKALGTATIEKYRSMRNSVGEKLDQIKRAIVPSHSNVSQRSSSSATTVAPLTITPPSQLLLHEPKHSREQERIDAVKRRIGDKTPIVCPKLFSRAAYMEAGALAGTLMIAGMLISMIFRSFIQTIPLIGILAIVLTFVRRQGLVATTAKRCAIAKNLYKKATENKDILSIFPLLTRHAQAQFLVGLDSEFRKATAKRHAGLKNMCAHIDTALSNCPDSFERTKALINLSKKGLGEEVVHALAEKDIDQLCQE